MRIGLVSAPTLTRGEIQRPDSIDLGQHVPLGLLAVAAVAHARGHEIQVIDSNDAQLGLAAGARLALAVTERLEAFEPDLVGFGSISASYPLTIAMATEYKRRNPTRIVVLGGPQASVVARETLYAFPEIDFIIRGEADLSFPDFLDRLAGRGDISKTDGLTFRHEGEICEHAMGAFPDLAQLPLPLYHLNHHIDRETTLALELGRGCPYACTFCSTNDFFRRRFRLKRPEQVLGEMRELAKRYGTSRFELVHDMFTVDRRKVIELCDVFSLAQEPFTWSVSARTDRVDPELLRRMHDAGCRGIFYGIETGSQRLQKVIRKRLDLGTAREALKVTSNLGMHSVASLIIGFPEETVEDLRGTVDFFVDSLRLRGVTPQLHLLAPLAGTPLARSHELVAAIAQSDLSANLGTSEERASIERHPDVFSSFLALPSCLPRSVLAGLREFLIEAAVELRWLLIALHDEWHSLELAERFFAWSCQSGELCRDSILEFVRVELLRETRAPRALTSLLMLYEPNEELEEPSPDEARQGFGGLQLGSEVRLVRLPVDYVELLTALTDAKDLASLPPVDRAYLIRTSGPKPEVIEIDFQLAEVLEACRGDHTADELCSISALPRVEVLAALQQLQAGGLLA